MDRAPDDITTLLQAHVAGHAHALDRLIPQVYGELHRIASGRLRRESGDHTLSATELVHEAFLKLVPLDQVDWQSRLHFFAIASRAMRNVLVDHAVRRSAGKRGGGHPVMSLHAIPDEAAPAVDESPLEDLIVLAQALARLEQLDERQARVVECRYFGGLNLNETAEALGISAATVSRDWTFARAWLHRELMAAG
jgi:RNA polymerase sigma factor (TIGR02999 family)